MIEGGISLSVGLAHVGGLALAVEDVLEVLRFVQDLKEEGTKCRAAAHNTAVAA